MIHSPDAKGVRMMELCEMQQTAGSELKRADTKPSRWSGESHPTIVAARCCA
jgi:hypothetical protein